MDYSTLTDDDLDQAALAIQAEQERRRTIEYAEGAITRMNAAYLVARDGEEEAPAWVMPTGAHDAYPAGHRVTYNGNVWESLTPANVWEPGDSGWRQVAAPAPDPETPPAPPAWTQPTGAHDAYPLGSQVTHNGRVWESVHSANVWAPPTEWKDLGAA